MIQRVENVPLDAPGIFWISTNGQARQMYAHTGFFFNHHSVVNKRMTDAGDSEIATKIYNQHGIYLLDCEYKVIKI